MEGISFFFFNDTATTEIYTLSLHDALPISGMRLPWRASLRKALKSGWIIGGPGRESRPALPAAVPREPLGELLLAGRGVRSRFPTARFLARETFLHRRS